MSVYTQDSPGTWNTWSKKKENQNLPILEAKRKYLKEQLLFEEQFANFVAQQQSMQADANTVAGAQNLNKIENVDFVSSPAFLSQTANTQSITAQFTFPVTVAGGVPTITVNNNQAGSGSASSFTYGYSGGSGTSKLTFEHIHPAFPANNGGSSANVLPIQEVSSTGSLSRGAIVNGPTSPVNGTYTAATYTTGTTSGSSAVFDVIVAGGSITAIYATAAGNEFIEGDTVTFDNDELGVGSTGGGFDISANNLTGDVISIPAQSITLNSATITTYAGEWNTQINDAIRRQGINPPLTTPGQVLTKRVIAG